MRKKIMNKTALFSADSERFINIIESKRRLSNQEMKKIMKDLCVGDFMINYVRAKKFKRIYKFSKIRNAPTEICYYEIGDKDYA